MRKFELKYLKETGCSENVIKHCMAVAEKAMEIGERVKIKVDEDILIRGALHHDIGRSRTDGIQHAVRGAEIAQELGMEDDVISIIERHIGSGISRVEAGKLGLPIKDYIPATPEEIIVSYADNLVWGERTVTFEESLEWFKRNLGDEHPAVERFVQMHELIESWKNNEKE